MTAEPLKRRPLRTRPGQPLLGELSLTPARVHEFCGNARRSLAMLLAGAMQGPVFWVHPGWGAEQLNPHAMLEFANPGRFTFVSPGRSEDILWCMEEILRSGAVPLVVTELPMPAALTPVRRLHLAAETGAEKGGMRPIGVVLSAGDGGSLGVESRWQMDGGHGAQNRGWTLTRLRARSLPPKTWQVKPKGPGFALSPAPPTGGAFGTIS